LEEKLPEDIRAIYLMAEQWAQGDRVGVV